MKFVFLLACVGLAVTASLPAKVARTRIADKNFLMKQKFLFEIVYRVESPPLFEEYIKLGKDFTLDKENYTEFDFNMKNFWKAYQDGILLPRGKFFGALVQTHHKQAWGLFNFFKYAKDWESFVRNVAWARIHINEGMFVYALTLAVIHREDTKGLIMPSITEIFPQYFFNSNFVLKAERFNMDVWNKYKMIENELYDIYYGYNVTNYVPAQSWSIFEWWKGMGMGNHWYIEENFILRENIYQCIENAQWSSMMKDVYKFIMPVDYTADLDYLSYFTEDLGWNAYWYYLNMDYAFFLDGKSLSLNKDRRGEWWIYNLQQMLARYYMERLSHEEEKIPEFDFSGSVQNGYDPELITYNGDGFIGRPNYWTVENDDNMNMVNNVRQAIERVDHIVEAGIFYTNDGKTINMRTPESVEIIANLLQANIDSYDRFFFNNWLMFAHMLQSDVTPYETDVYPDVLLNFETMLRDPLFYIFYKKIADVYVRFQKNLTPYTQKELKFEGVKITDVKISELKTYYDLVDFDTSNLLNDKMTFVDGKFVWDKALFARQLRLNHKPFDFEFTIESDKETQVVIRTFLGPEQSTSLSDNRQNFIKLDEFQYELVIGKNFIMRGSDEFLWTAKDRTTYTELYKYVLLALKGKYKFPLDLTDPHSAFPDRLLLPRGWDEGMPMKMFFFVTPQTADIEQRPSNDLTDSSGIGSGVLFIDNKPFGYPLDREIDENEFDVPNMFFADVKIYHVNSFDKYYKEDFKPQGKFDYTFFNDYYTNYENRFK